MGAARRNPLSAPNYSGVNTRIRAAKLLRKFERKSLARRKFHREFFDHLRKSREIFSAAS